MDDIHTKWQNAARQVMFGGAALLATAVWLIPYSTDAAKARNVSAEAPARDPSVIYMIQWRGPTETDRATLLPAATPNSRRRST